MTAGADLNSLLGGLVLFLVIGGPIVALIWYLSKRHADG
jgi:hypothetical protein